MDTPDFCTSRRVSVDLCISAFALLFLQARRQYPQKEVHIMALYLVQAAHNEKCLKLLLHLV